MFPRDKYSNILRFSPILGIGFQGLTLVSFELIGMNGSSDYSINLQNHKERNLCIQFSRSFVSLVND